MNSLHLILYVLALVCFGLSAFPLSSPYWNRLVSIGLAALTLTLIL